MSLDTDRAEGTGALRIIEAGQGDPGRGSSPAAPCQSLRAASSAGAGQDAGAAVEQLAQELVPGGLFRCYGVTCQRLRLASSAAALRGVVQIAELVHQSQILGIPDPSRPGPRRLSASSGLRPRPLPTRPTKR